MSTTNPTTTSDVKIIKKYRIYLNGRGYTKVIFECTSCNKEVLTDSGTFRLRKTTICKECIKKTPSKPIERPYRGPCSVSNCSREKGIVSDLCVRHRQRQRLGLPIVSVKNTKLCKCGLREIRITTPLCQPCSHKTEAFLVQRRIRERGRKPSLDRKLKCNMRRRFKKAWDRQSRSGKVIQMLGCTIEELKKHLESKFYPHPETNDSRYPQEGLFMTFNNYGAGYAKWHIDHIIPIQEGHKGNIEEEKLWHYTNLQPLWSYDNLRKGAKA